MRGDEREETQRRKLPRVKLIQTEPVFCHQDASSRSDGTFNEEKRVWERENPAGIRETQTGSETGGFHFWKLHVNKTRLIKYF